MARTSEKAWEADRVAGLQLANDYVTKPFSPREVAVRALRYRAAAVILAHNHPSGVAEPSQADERITKRLKSALELVDIRLLDHLIIGHGRATSLASRGML